MNTDAPIVFLDSGKGGVPYLMEYRAYDVARRLIYVADTEFFPYGTKGSAQLCQNLRAVVSTIVDRFDPALVVLACNTASVTALKWLRRRFTVPLVGVVPAVKPASLHTPEAPIGILVTERTATDHYLHDLIGQFAADRPITTVAAGNIVNYVESKATALSIDPSPTVDTIIDEALAEFKQANVHVLVLGCTHFVYLIDHLKRKSNQQMKIIDSRAGVRERIRELIKSISPVAKQNASSTHSEIECYTTAPTISHSFSQLLVHCDIDHRGML